MMKFYFAPMEGLTGYIYRNAHRALFPAGIEKYFSPFIFANQSDSLKAREIKDILPENNPGIVLIPQILTNNADDFIHTAKRINLLGYHEINLNLGCPSGTVVSKGRGSGFLTERAELDAFLDKIFSNPVAKISIKTRIGKDRPEEFDELIEIYNKYPLEELIIHPRVQTDFYKNTPNMGVFSAAFQKSKNPVCYNGDLFTKEAINGFFAVHPNVETIMLGRGLLMNPCLVQAYLHNAKLNKPLLKHFHDQVYDGYKNILFGDVNVLYKMKELWNYMIESFAGNAKHLKRIKKSQSLRDYNEAVSLLFHDLDLADMG